jgi:predicted AlkP superfamily phosphohydrolase/phosphomutase
MTREKLLVVGLDCATPELFFDRHLGNIPAIKQLQAAGYRARLRSSDPPITIPAWACMATGKTPGQLGVYGFRHLQKGTYDKTWVANSTSIRGTPVWETLGDNGFTSIVVGVPPTYPVRPFNGNLISCFITPSVENEFTNPPELKQEILDRFGSYTFDVPFRIDDKADLFTGLLQMTKDRHEVIKYLLENKEWDLCWFVEIGLDRMHHAFWKYFDETRDDFSPGTPYQHYIDEYEQLLDCNFKELVGLVPEDTRIIVVSDHGAQSMDGCLCVNEWLVQEDLLHVNSYPPAGETVPPEKMDVDWASTTAIGWGGYYARIFMNVAGREPEGIIPLEDYETARAELRERIEAMAGPDGTPLGNKTFTADELYPEGHVGDEPDLFVYFADLRWRSAGTFGHPGLFLKENDTGPDDAVHAKEGLFISATKHQFDEAANEDAELDARLASSAIQQVSIYDIYPTILTHFGLPVPTGLRGKPIELE